MNFRGLSEMINEIICDNILRKFEGNKSFDRKYLKQREFYSNIDPDYEVVEDHINFLIRDHTLKDTGTEISLTTKGWFILTNADKVGYVAQRIESAKAEMVDRETRKLFRWVTLVVGCLMLAWLVYKYTALEG
jgi:hypothetical protein